jgi:hypothetical protein
LDALAAAPVAIQEYPSPATNTCAGDEYLSFDLELESSTCYFWYKVHLIKKAWLQVAKEKPGTGY